MNQDYIADQIERIENRCRGNRELILDCCWRIASNADLFGDNLNADGTLCVTQQQQVNQFIGEFKATNNTRRA